MYNGVANNLPETIGDYKLEEKIELLKNEFSKITIKIKRTK